MSHIFISYSKQNIDFVRYLRRLLEGEGFAVWLDEAQLTPSARWWKSIEQNIETCAAFVIVMSPDAADSDWVEREILLAEKLHRPIFPVLLSGESWSRLANIQYEDMRAGLHASLSPHFLNGLRAKVKPRDPTAPRSIEFTMDWGDILEVEADVIALKYAQKLYGADLAMVNALNAVGIDPPVPEPGKYTLVESGGAVPARHVLFIGVPILKFFGYQQIREWAFRAMSIIKEMLPETRHIAMTLHGPGRSLDPAEALLSQFAGLRDAMLAGELPPALERITITEFDSNRIERLRPVIDSALADADYASPFADGWGYTLALSGASAAAQAEPSIIESAGTPETKPYAYVALPPLPDSEDVFYYGLQTPVHALGLLCERIENPVFTADQLEQIESRISTAGVFIADLTGNDPMVYLQVGLAWGKSCPTILVAKHGQKPRFDTQGQPIITYERIKDLESQVARTLDLLKVSS